MHLSPAEYVVHVFKGVRATARVLKVSPQAVIYWKHSRDEDGFLGRIPSQHYHAIIAAAERLGVDVTAHDLVHGRKIRSDSDSP